jgi:hypothetical protein
VKKGRTWVSGVSERGWSLGKANSKFGHDVCCTEAKKKRDSSKMHEQTGYIYENKGSDFHSPTKNGNVIENKYAYEFRARMLLKRR